MSDNENRRASARKAIAAFKDATRMDGEDQPTIISDLLSNLMHHCHFRGLDFHDLVRRAEANFEEEI